MERVIIVLIIILTFLYKAPAQVNFIFLPEVKGRTVDGLGDFQVQNLSGQALKGIIIVSVKENTQNLNVVSIRTLETTIPTGMFSFPRGNYVNSRFIFSNNSLAAITSQSRSFPPGEYTFCYQFISSPEHGNSDYQDCFESSIQPLVPIELLNPEDKDSICNKRPMLSWQPPMPMSPSTRFRLLLTEKKQGTSIENLLVNAPLVLLNNISSTTVNYLATSPDLKEGKTYCWQVIAYQKGITLSRSQIWEFTVKCKEAEAKKPNDSYRELKFLVNGNYYIANSVLKFSFRNNYNVKKLSYALIDITNGFKAIKNIPEVKVNPGLNNIDIDLTELGLNPDKQYLLKVFPFNEQDIEVRFTYKENEN